MLAIVPEELTEHNHEYWKICLKTYLMGQGLWDVVSGKEKRPAEKHTQQYEEWKRKNASALHAIQMSCGPGIYHKFMEPHVSAKYAWEHLAEKRRPSDSILLDHEESTGKDKGNADYHHYEPLYKAVEEGDLHFTKEYLKSNPSATRARISSKGDTALHVAILSDSLKIAEELVKLMQPADLELTNDFGETPLSLAAISDSKRLAKAMVHKNHNLVSIMNEHGDDGQLPVIVAALYGRKHMVQYLYSVTPKEELRPENGTKGATLLNSLITAEIYDVAFLLLERYPQLGVTEDHYGDYTIRVLAHKPSAFPSGTKHVFWKRWIYSFVWVHLPRFDSQDSEGPIDKEHIEPPRLDVEHGRESHEHGTEIHAFNDEDNSRRSQHDPSHRKNIKRKVLHLLHQLLWILLRFLVPDIKHIHDRKLIHDEAGKLLSCIFKVLPKLSDSKLEKIGLDKAIHDAIKHGIIEFVEEMLKYNPEIIWRKDKKGRTIFSHAIVLRQEKIFSLIYGLGTKMRMIARRHDIFGNNFLHLAAKLSPPAQLDRVSGAALQMQRELQWYKEVESMVQPKYKEERNEKHKTPSTLFTDEHQKLAKEGERWMKNTAGSSMIVGTLIAAVMFTTAFTVPGGNDDYTGLPILLKKDSRAFMIFMVSNGFSMFTSSTSVLMFLGILTARYAEDDFLKSLPTKLILGLACLFFSIVTMMVSFGSALYMLLHKRLSWVSIPIIVFSTVPVVLFCVLQFPLLIEMIIRTYGAGIFKKPKKSKCSCGIFRCKIFPFCCG